MNLAQALDAAKWNATEYGANFTIDRYFNGYAVTNLLWSLADRGYQSRYIVTPQGAVLHYSNLVPATSVSPSHEYSRRC